MPTAIQLAELDAEVDLAAVDGHHVPGTAYHWRHDWHPLDVRTALLNRKKAAARALHAKGAPHFIPENDENKFHAGVKPVKGGLSVAPAPPRKPEPPKPPKRPAGPRPAVSGNDAEIKKLLKSVGGVSKLHNADDETLRRLGELGHERALIHLRTREYIHKTHVVERARRFEQTSERIRKAGGTPGTHVPYTTEQLRDLERRNVAAILSRKAKADKADAAKKARDEAKSKAEADPGRLQKVIDEIANSHTDDLGDRRYNRYSWPLEDLERAAAAGDERSLAAIPIVKRRMAKAARAGKAAGERAERGNDRNVEGDPVSKALRNNTRGDVRAGVERAMAAIDKVHHDGELYPIPVKNSSASSRYGQYTYRNSMFGAPGLDDNITISKGGDHHATTMAHEVGHWLDRRALGTGSNGRPEMLGGQLAFKSESAAAAGKHVLGAGVQPEVEPEWAAWWEAVDGSDAIKQMRSTRVPGQEKYRNYTLTPREMWARSYAQYISLRSGDPKMQQEIADLVAIRDAENWRKLQGYSQWTPEDFEPIAQAIDGILAAKGWKK